MYVKVTNGAADQYPYTVANLRRDNPNTSFPKRIPDEMLASWGVYPVSSEQPPSLDARTQELQQNALPHQDGDAWVIGWTVNTKTSEQIADYDTAITNANREERNERLKETDFYALSDVTMSAEMATYRQALRDITSHANWPHLDDNDWPTKP